MKLESLLQKIKADTFSVGDASKVGLTRYYLRRLIEEELILELQRGIYKKVDGGELDDIQVLSFEVATIKLKERSAICLWSALSYYGLTDEVPSKVWCLVPYPYSIPSVRSIRSKNPKWDIGIDSHKSFSITSIERTIVDCFLKPRYVPVSESFSALKVAIKDKKTSLKKVLDMANNLGAKEKILPFLEIVI